MSLTKKEREEIANITRPRSPRDEWEVAILMLGANTADQEVANMRQRFVNTMLRLVNNKEAHLLFCRYVREQILDDFEHTHPAVLYRVLHWLTGTFNTVESDDILRRVRRGIQQETIDRHNRLLGELFGGSLPARAA